MKPVVAAFDLDGTLTKHDTLVPFLRAAVVVAGRTPGAGAAGVIRWRVACMSGAPAG